MRALLLMVGCLVMVGCTFGAATCESGCPTGSTCDVASGFCVSDDGGTGGGGAVTGGGTGGGTTGGSMGGGGGATGGGQGTSYCAAGLSCSPWLECVPSTTGGTCEDAQLELTWTLPTPGLRTNAAVVIGELTLSKRDGGVVRAGVSPPDVVGPPGSAAVVSGSASPFAVTITLLPNDGVQTYSAGWVGGPARVPISIERDTAGPEFVIQPLPDAGYGVSSADFLPVDPGAPGSYRKDEVLTVRVTTTAPDVASVKLVARYGTEQRHEVTTSNNCTVGNGRCDDFRLDLSLVSMTDFRGSIRLTAEGTDTLGNIATTQAPVDVPVTRWQWARRLGGLGVGSLRSVPALGTGGRIFVGISNGTANGLAAVDPDGGVPWVPVSDGPVEGPVAVGRGASGEWLFYNPNSGPAKSLLAVTGAASSACSAGASAATTVGGVALFAENTGNLGSISLQPATVGIRGQYNEAPQANCYSSAGGLVGVGVPGNMVIGTSSAFFADTDGNLRRLGLAPASSPTLSTLSQSLGGVGVVNGLAMISGTRVAGGGGPGIGRVFAYDVTPGTVDSSANAWPSATAMASPTSGPSVGTGGVFAQVRVSGQSNLFRINTATGVVVAQSAALGVGGVLSAFTGSGAPTPTLGTGNKAYVVDERGSLFVVPQDFAMNANASWAVALPAALVASGTVVTASPTLDCNRRVPGSESGVLYIATETGWLVSYLVDSKGLDPTAPWPKYARDARNTGNFSGPAISCP